MKILITGSNGLLGQKIVKLCVKYHISFLATSKGENRNPDCPDSNYFPMDITNKLEMNAVFNSFYPSHVIHTAAITNVDYCELHPEECDYINIMGTRHLFDVCQRYEAHFVLLSTDFVFDGSKGNYSENDPVNPISHYARSKVAAENFLMQSSYRKWAIARTIIVYGQAHNISRSNLVLWVYNSLKEKKTIHVVTDQFRTPTWAEDLAWGCVELARQNKTGIFHLSGRDYLSMYDFALLVADFFHLDKQLIKPISSGSLNQSAKRPPKTGFDISKAKKEIGFSPKSIKETLGLLKF